jgi:hypothetical protein
MLLVHVDHKNQILELEHLMGMELRSFEQSCSSFSALQERCYVDS